MIKILNLKDIRVDPDQPRKTKDKEALASLSRSIETIGLRKTIKVRKITDPDYKYQVINGERRFLAHLHSPKLLSVGTIKADIANMSEADIYLEQLADNENRENLTFSNRIQALQRGVEKGYSVADLMAVTGEKQSNIEKMLGLYNELPLTILGAVDSGDISQEVVSMLVNFPRDKRQKAFNKAVGKTTKKAKAALEVYMADINQSKIPDAETAEPADKSDIKSERKRLDRFSAQVGTFEKTVKLSLAVKGFSKELEKVELLAKTLKKLSSDLEKQALEYRAKQNKL
jgi:ParB/RepB/Spo0J family partition protein